MKQLVYSLAIAAAVLFSGCSPESEEQIVNESQAISGKLVQREQLVPIPDGTPFSKQKVDDYVKEIYTANGDFRWEQADFKMLWSVF